MGLTLQHYATERISHYLTLTKKNILSEANHIKTF